MSETTTEISKTDAAIEKLKAGETIALSDLLKIVAPDQAPATTEPSRQVVAVIPETTRVALERLTEVFGSVVPAERRALSTTEVASLIEEKATIKEIATSLSKREGDIKVAVFNHFDSVLEAQPDFDPEAAGRDANGYYLTKEKAATEPGETHTFTREVRESAPSLDTEALRQMADDPEVEGFDHEDYLALTTPVRVFDEAKATLALRKNPDLVKVLAKATRPGGKTSALYVRKA